MPIGQVEVQRILAEAQPFIEECTELARARDEARMASQFASLDIASMRHERLGSRLCMS